MPSSITPVTVRFSEETRNNLSQFAKLTNRSRSYVINQAVEAFLSTRMAYLQELNEAVESVDSQPTHAAKDVFDWMQTWGTEEEKPLTETKLNDAGDI
ncbi:CopG family ribbon-helix-helix protein [Leucothrix pacifica]|uniref:CopG family transcriptional regulator n=1 Tax=Leucothrix pacifica TaxID=1247513 RepID=A0A317CM42_9GAMM|nr:hypothetical protein [Leucothrix pacifica]PWQ99665.1 hypothetical protein DKW60_05150 [Leucothrix pacifica]